LQNILWDPKNWNSNPKFRGTLVGKFLRSNNFKTKKFRK
jgi:hypothetical protein